MKKLEKFDNSSCKRYKNEYSLLPNDEFLIFFHVGGRGERLYLARIAQNAQFSKSLDQRLWIKTHFRNNSREEG